MALRVSLDTDIGTDVDDCLALALILASHRATLMRIPKVGDQNPINVCLEVDVARFEAFLPER
jgi:inosine-uridine nucleoside N-ribohydrolase